MKLTNTIRDAFVLSAMNDVPSVDYTEKIREAAVKTAASMLPPKVRAIWNDKELRPYVATFYCYGGTSANLPGLNEEKVVKAVEETAEPLKVQRNGQTKRHDELRNKLRSVAYSVSTHKALAEALPEFAKYLPPDEASVNRSLPVVANVVADFVKAGWPKGAKKPAAVKV